MPYAFVVSQEGPGGITPSSTKLSQSLSTPSQLSASGVGAEHNDQPTDGLQVWSPKQVPNTFSRLQARALPALPSRQVQEPESGRQRPRMHS